MPADRLRPEDIDAAIEATQIQRRRHGPHLDPADLTPIEVSYRSRSRYDPEAGDPGIPPYPEKPRPDVVYADPESRLPASRRRRWSMLVAGLALGGFAAIIWWAYGTEPPGEPGPVPLIAAEEGAAKVRPESEGGLQVPFQDKLIYTQIEPDLDRDPVERLLPPPPAPIEPPEPPVAETEPPVAETEPPVTETEPPAVDAPPAIAPITTAEATAGQEEGAPNPPAVPAMPVLTMPIEESAEDGAAAPATTAGESEELPPAPPIKPRTAEAAPAEEPTLAAEEPAPAAEEPPQVARATGGFRIQLAAFRSPDHAKTAWTTLRGRHPDLLEPLELAVVRADLGDKGIFYRVQAGPLPDRSAAQSLCERLQQRKQACLIVAP